MQEQREFGKIEGGRTVDWLVRAWLLILYAISLAAAQAQVERGSSPKLGLLNGIVLSEERPVAFSEKVEVQRTEGAPVELGDFSLSFMLVLEKDHTGTEDADFLSLHGDKSAVSVSVTAEKGLQVKLDDLEWRAQTATPLAGRQVPVVLSVKRDGSQALAGLWVDGVEQARAMVKPGALRLKARPVVFGSTVLTGGIVGLRVHDRALGREEILELAGEKPAP